MKRRRYTHSRYTIFTNLSERCTAEEVAEWLFGKSSSDNQKLSHTISNEGSGELLGWQAFTGNENCFINKEHEQSPLKKILISTAFLKNRPLFTGEFPLFSALIEHYEVYLYEGPETNLLTATPLTSINEFLEKRDLIKPAKASKIKNDFAEQQISTSQWVILDHLTYMERWGKSRFVLDLTYMNLITQEEQEIVLQSVNPSEIKSIELLSPHPETLEFIFKYFKNLKEMHFYNVSGSWLEKNIHYLNGTTIENLIISDPVYTMKVTSSEPKYSLEINFPSVYGIKNLVISSLIENLDLFRLSLPETESLKLFIPFGSLAKHEYLPKSELFFRLHKVHFKYQNDIYLRDTIFESEIHRTYTIRITNKSKYETLINSDECMKVVSLKIFTILTKEEIHSIGIYFPLLKWLHYKTDQLGRLEIPDLQFLEYLLLETPKAECILGFCPKLLELNVKAKTLVCNRPFYSLKNSMIDTVNSFYFNNEFFPEIETLDITDDDNVDPDNISVKKITLTRKMKKFIHSSSNSPLEIITNNALRNLQIDGAGESTVIKLSLEKSDQLRHLVFSNYQNEDVRKITGLHSKKLLSLEGILLKDLILSNTTLPPSVIITSPQEKKDSVLTNLNEQKEKKQKYDAKSIPPVPHNPTRTDIIGVSFFSLKPISRPCIPTGKIGINSGQGHFKAYLSDGSDKPIRVRDYRIQMYNQIELQSDDCLVFSSTPLDISDIEYSIITNEIQQRQKHLHPQINIGIFEGTLVKGQDYPLPLTGPVTQKDFFNIYQQFNIPGVEIGLYHDSNLQHYFVRLLKAPKDTANIKLWYDFSIDKNYHSESMFEPAEMKNALPEKIAETIQKEFQHNPELAFLFDETLTLTQKISQLEIFCRFNDEALQASVKDETFSALLASIKERRGVCEHRAHAFMLLSRFIGVDVHMIGNETHLYCEVRTQNGTFRPIELGGGTIRNDLKTNRHPNQILQAFPNNPLSTLLPLPDVKDNMYEQPRYSFKEFKTKNPEIKKRPYESVIRSHLTEYSPFDWELFKKSIKPVLIYLPKDKVVDTIRSEYFKKSQIPNGDKNYLYISNPLDFKRYGETYRLEEKHRIPVKGLLSNILEKGGTLLINWANFSYDEKMNYSSLWAPHPRLKDQPIKGPIKIVGLLNENMSCPPTFLSESQVCTLPIFPAHDIVQEEKETIEMKDSLNHENEPIHVDLLEGADWYEKWVGEIIFDKDHYTIKEGPLLEAIRTKRPLIIHRPPNNNSFNQFLADIQIDRRFLFNTEWKDIPKGISIEVSKEPAPQTTLARKSSISIQYVPHDSDVKGEKIYLNINNWHTLFKELEFDLDEKTVRTQPGKLEQQYLHKKPLVFYVTDTIPDIEWERLTLFISQHYPDTPYTFQFAPGISGPGVKSSFKIENKQLTDSKKIMESIKKDFQKDQLSRCYISNDPNYLGEKLCELYPAEKLPLIIDLTPQLSVTDLLVKIKMFKPKRSPISEEKTKNNALQFTIKTGVLFNALKAGKTIILKGEISQHIMQQLLPLFSDTPYLEFNRKRIPISGRLILIQPIKTKYLSSVISTIPCHFSFEDYRIDLLSLNSNLLMLDQDKLKEKNDMFDKLFLFFSAATYPHRGQAMPDDLGVTWERLSDMWRSLSEKAPHDIAHRHNPFKENMLYDYDKDGEYYAFLNVISKFLFDNTLEECDIHLKKYHLLPEDVKNAQTINWFLLNTCNGKKLREILGERWLVNIIQQKKSDLSILVKNNALTEAQWLLVRDKLNKSVNEINAKKLSIKESKEVSLESKEVSLEPKKVSKKRKTMSSKKPIKETSTLSKTEKRLKYLIENKPHSSVIVYKGDPGVGKTYFLNKLSENKKYACYNGLTNIKKWLLDQTPGKIKLLLVDEANTFEPGTLDLLYGLKRKSKTITYKGISYPVTPLHKVVAAVNPEYFSGRYYHNLLRLGASTVLARMPKADDLKKWLMSTYKVSFSFAENVLIGANLFKKYRPLISYSFRDLQNAMLRYDLLVKEEKTATSVLPILYKALIGEFGITITKINEHRQFKIDLANELKMSLPAASKKISTIVVNDYVFPSKMADAQEAIRQGLLIREYVCQHPQTAYKRGLVLQGLPGIGKWTLCQQMLKNSGLVEASIDSDILDSQKHYLVVSASESYMKRSNEKKSTEKDSTKTELSIQEGEESYFRYVAKKAFDNGMTLVIKNLDLLNPADERFLGGLLTGVHEGQPAKKPGFFVLGLKTLNNEQESALSPALCNRMQILQIPHFGKNSWTLMANQVFHDIDKARAFVEDFWNPQKPYSRPVTSHDFFNCLQEIAPQKQLTTTSTSTFRLFNSRKHKRSSDKEENGKNKQLKL
jgi:hypothetical protein